MVGRPADKFMGCRLLAVTSRLCKRKGLTSTSAAVPQPGYCSHFKFTRVQWLLSDAQSALKHTRATPSERLLPLTLRPAVAIASRTALEKGLKGVTVKLYLANGKEAPLARWRD
jgi:hypothetical protein